MQDQNEKRNKPGSQWRLLTHDETTAVELENKGIFDELVVDQWLHLEQLDDSSWWMRLGDARILIRVGEDGTATVDVERGFYGEERGSTKFIR